MAGEALGVGDDDGTSRLAEHPAQRIDLGGGGTAPGRGVGLVGDEHRLRRDLRAVDPAGLGGADQLLHDLTYVVHVQAGAVESAVGSDRCEHLADRLQAALDRSVGSFDDEGRCTHPDDHSVPALVERGGDLASHVLNRRGTGSQEAGADPGQQNVAAHVVRRHDDHPAAAARANPVLGHRHGLRRTGAGGVDLGVRPPCADEFGELRMPHRQAAEDEAAVVLEPFDFQQMTQFRQAPVHLGGSRFRTRHTGPHGLQRQDLFPAATVGHVPLDVGRELPISGEGRGEDDAGVVAHGLGQAPLLGQQSAQSGGTVVHHQRNAGVAQRVESGA